MVNSALPPPDHWLDIVTGIGAILGGSAGAGGAVLAFLFGRRASVSISADVHTTPRGFVVSTRPKVRAVGIFRVGFGDDRGVVVRLTEVGVDPDGDLQETDNAWEHTGAFGQQYVDPGEELTTTVTFAPMNPEPSVIGWMVYLRISAPTRLARVRTAWWVTQVFVTRPASEQG